MKDPVDNNSYTIDINNTEITFTCADGDEHVEKLTKKLKQTIEAASNQEPGQVLSKYGMKIALLLADEVVSEQTAGETLRQSTEEKLHAVINQLDEILGIE